MAEVRSVIGQSFALLPSRPLRAAIIQPLSVASGLASVSRVATHKLPPQTHISPFSDGPSFQAPRKIGTGNSSSKLCIVLPRRNFIRSEEHTSEFQSLMRTSYAVFCLKKKTNRHIVHRP